MCHEKETLLTFMFRTGDFALWSGNQPNNIGGVQHCGVLDRENNYRMADEACDGYNAYVCDIRKHASLFIKSVDILGCIDTKRKGKK